MLAVYLDGNVSVTYGYKFVNGNQDSRYTTELAAGMDLYIANNFTGTSELDFVGQIAMVINDSLAYLKEGSPVTQSGPHPAVIVPGVSVTTDKSLRITTSLIPDGYKPLVQHLIESVQFGMFKNTTTVQTYHSPIADPKTGQPVNLPATVYSKDTGASASEALLNPINILGTGKTTNNTGALGPGSSSLQTQNMIPGYQTPSDRYGGQMKSSLTRSMISDPGPPYTLSALQKDLLSTTTNNDLRLPSLPDQFVVSSGAPISGTPGTSTLVPTNKPIITFDLINLQLNIGIPIND
jgi:hypothetical protein